jgi:uncharacterized membrane protein YphA (DoxX/SURF4 family)
MADLDGRLSVKPVGRTLLRHPWLTFLLRVGLGGVFIAAAVPKIADPPGFAHAVYNYHLLPGIAVNAVAIVLPWFELFLGLALISGLFAGTAARWCAVLLVAFMVGLSVNLGRGNPVNCGCFAVSSAHKSRAELLRDMKLDLLRDVAFLLAAAQVIATFEPRRRRKMNE